MKTYIVSVGTSVITNYKRKFPYKASFDIDDVVNHLRLSLEKSALEDTSAEIKTLVKAGVSPDDNVYLLATDTDDGIIASHIIKTFITGILNNPNVKDYSIEGLQVSDPKRFREKGIKNLLNFIQDIKLREVPSEHRLIVSGGFKAVVPYLTLAGMLYDIAVLYIFENTEELIELPPIPINFDIDFIESLSNIFIRVEKDGFINKESFEDEIAGRTDKKKINSFFIQKGDMVIPSEIAYLLWKAYKFKNG